MSRTIPVSPTTARYRWVMLLLCALTPLSAVTLPNLSLPPLFATISADLNMTLVETGLIWGTGSFMAIFFALIGGTLGDRFGTRATLVTACIAAGILGMTRALATDFTSLLLTMLVYSSFQAILPVMVFKVARQWFPPSQIGMASGVIASGFATGLMLGPLLSTSVIVPVLGGWRQALVLYGIIAIALGIAWFLVHPVARKADPATPANRSFINSLRHVARLRGVWVLSIGGLGINACFQGFTGYLPTYLKSIGWNELDADQALAVFFLASLSAVIPLSILSDKLRLRRGFLITTALILGIGIGSIALVDGSRVILVIALTGFVFDAFMAISSASVLEVKGVDHFYIGTALGLSTMVRSVGAAFSPAIGNSLIVYGANIPFLFWGGMGLLAVCIYLLFLKPTTVKDETLADAIADAA